MLSSVQSGESLGGTRATGCVERRFFLVKSKCPLCIATDCGGYLRTSLDVSLGHVVKRPTSIVVHLVDRAGEKQKACRLAILAAMVEEGLIALHEKEGTQWLATRLGTWHC
jgi:hypothetical protein